MHHKHKNAGKKKIAEIKNKPKDLPKRISFIVAPCMCIIFKVPFSFSDVIAAVLFISALYKLNTSNTATDKSKGMIYFMFMLGMLALLYLFNVKSSRSKWLVHDALVVGGILRCLTGEPFSLYFKQV